MRNVCSCVEGPIDSGILYLHSMSSPRINEDFKKHLDPFVELCHDCGHNPASALVITTLWPDDESEEEVRKRTEELKEKFQTTTTSEIYRIPDPVHFDGSRSSASNAIDLLTKDILKRTRDITHKTQSISILHLRRTVSDSEPCSQLPFIFLISCFLIYLAYKILYPFTWLVSPRW